MTQEMQRMQEIQKRLLGSLGLCAKAGRLIYGTPMVVEAMQRGREVLAVLEASDTSANTHKRLSDKCSFYGIEKIQLPLDGDALAHAVGKHSALAAVAITDRGFYEMIIKNLE